MRGASAGRIGERFQRRSLTLLEYPSCLLESEGLGTSIGKFTASLRAISRFFVHACGNRLTWASLISQVLEINWRGGDANSQVPGVVGRGFSSWLE
jgi:hypothetical protein